MKEETGKGEFQGTSLNPRLLQGEHPSAVRLFLLHVEVEA